MNNFTSLDLRHKKAFIRYIKLFTTSLQQLRKYVPDKDKKLVLDQISQEVEDFDNFLGDKETNEIIQDIEDEMDETLKLTWNFK